MFALFTIIAIVLVLLVATAGQHRQHALDTDPRLCRHCGQSHPPYAHFCRRCGMNLIPDQADRRGVVNR